MTIKDFNDVLWFGNNMNRGIVIKKIFFKVC